MPDLIALPKTPKFQFDTSVGGYDYTIQLMTGQSPISLPQDRGLTYISITRNGEVLLTNWRVIPWQLILQFPYLEAGCGNFVMSSSDDQYPHYSGFGSLYNLYYLSQPEADGMRGA